MLSATSSRIGFISCGRRSTLAASGLTASLYKYVVHGDAALERFPRHLFVDSYTSPIETNYTQMQSTHPSGVKHRQPHRQKKQTGAAHTRNPCNACFSRWNLGSSTGDAFLCLENGDDACGLVGSRFSLAVDAWLAGIVDLSLEAPLDPKPCDDHWRISFSGRRRGKWH
jgi:hypothetical protein